MPARSLTPDELATRCDPASLALDDLAAQPGYNVDDTGSIVGQARARAAVEFGIAMTRRGHHLFVMGPSGAGKETLVRRTIEAQLARCTPQRFDWVYVNDFEQPHRPRALQLPAGRGVELRKHMRALVDELRTMIPATFESDEYVNAVERLNAEFKDRAERSVLEVGEEAQRHGLAMIRTPVGFSFAPRKGESEVLTGPEFEALPQEERERLLQAMSAAQDQLLRTLRASVRLRKEHSDRLRALNRSMTLVAIEHAVDDARGHYADLPLVCSYLDDVRADVTEKADAFRHAEGEEGGPTEGADLSGYEVNVVVDAGANGTPIVEVDHPTHNELVGRVDHVARMGTLLTDYRLIKPGALHRANGGYLLIDAVKLLTQPFAWDALKRALMRGEVRIESMAEAFSLVSTVQLEPVPIPLDVKVILFGKREIGQLLQAYDSDFNQLFRVIADFDDEIARGPLTQRELASSLIAQARKLALALPDARAMARLIDHGSRLAGDATRITASVRDLLDVLMEGDHLARLAGRAQVDLRDVDTAIAARRERASRIHRRMQQEVARDVLMIATSGERVGQVNGLMVFQVGQEMYGEPVRISATTRFGEGEVVDIQRETELGGPLHAKGVLILSSFIAARYSRFHPHALSASLVFEQTYGLVEGDSASLAELLALLSSIAFVPVKQCFAVTGSVNQFGDVQAIGAVNEKIEGFFDICAARGLDGTHGVIVPRANVAHLMLRDDVIAAVAAGRFQIQSVSHVDDAIELVSGLPSGDPMAPDPESINGRIVARLRENGMARRGARGRVQRGRRGPPLRESGEDHSGAS